MHEWNLNVNLVDLTQIEIYTAYATGGIYNRGIKA